MNRSIKWAGVATLLLGSVFVRGQSVGPTAVNAAGGSGTAGGNTFEWSIGEIAWPSPVSGSHITQGVLQPRIVPVSVQTADLANRLGVFPNPSNSFVNVTLHAQSSGQMTCRLTDIAGRILKETVKEVTVGSNAQQLDITLLAVANYMLQVTISYSNAQTETATYQIHKLQ